MFQVIATASNTNMVQSTHKTLGAAIRAAKKHRTACWIKDTETGESFDKNGNPSF